MEGIVVGIAKINLCKNLTEKMTENNLQNFDKESVAAMPVCNLEESTNVCQQDMNDNTCDVEAVGESGWEEIDFGLETDIPSKKGFTLAERRQMPARSSKESSLLGIKRRTIMKPSKRNKNQEDFQNLKPSHIKKIYLNKKLTNFKPSCLETIFEETSTFHNEKDCTRLMGGRKIKRSLSFSDGYRYNKTIVNKRRAKIRKTFGKRFALKKISLEDFLTKLNTSIEKTENVPNHNSQIQSGKSVNQKEFLHSELVDINTTVTSDDDAMASKCIPTTVSNEFITNNVSLVDQY